MGIILAEAAVYGDKFAAEKWDVTTRTVRNYRAKLEEDKKLSSVFREKLDLLSNKWIEEAPQAMSAAVDYLKRAAQEGSPKDPEHVIAIATSLKILATVITTRKVIDARLAQSD